MREKRGLTQGEVAEQVGVSARAYAFWERKPVALRAKQIARLADVLEVSADFLVGRDAPKPKRNGPKGRLEQLFEEASQLSRGEQQKISAVLEPFVQQHTSA